ncbi:MAG TPA: SUMF1/EgtB/PvdO family nonheme iron enzyme [Spirochaetia bacterium]|nr:SUMF1/EgtB/PvdO family nonheme iron enzyme [Spirochaetia bacterium]
MSADTPSPDPVEDIQVRLQPIFGVEPKYYLAGLYGVLLLGILFSLLVLPGILKPGTRVTVTSTPPGAAVTWGGKTWGATPVTVFLPEGKGSLVVSKPGFEPQTRDYASGNDLLFSLFLPRSDAVSAQLKPTSADSVANLYRAEVGRWSLAVPFTSEYRFPPLFTRFAADAAAAGWDLDKIKSFLLGMREAVADPQMYLDYGRALGLWAVDGAVPGDLESQYKLWAPLVGEGQGRLALWLLANQAKPDRLRETTDQSDWFRARTAEFQASLKQATVAPAAAPASLKSAAGTFRGVPGATFLWGATGTSVALPVDPPYELLPVPVTVAGFWIADREVTQGEFAAFVAANPQWAPGARDTLTAAGLADADFLVGWVEGKPTAPSDPVSSVSWYAAKAYADWLNATGKVPAGKKAILPDDFQWEAAARATGGAGMMNQGVWEWTSSSWYPGQSFVWTAAVPAEPTSWARSLKGGFQNAKGAVKPGDRAGWPASGATPGLGFRIALVGAP